MENECIIITLIYLERLKLATGGRLVVRRENWKSLLLACIMMASKVWDDLSMQNVDFSQICPYFNLKAVNAFETALLEILMYEVRVSASCYAKYYFHLRSMMSMLGLLSADINHQEPLDIKAANKLKLSPSKDSHKALKELEEVAVTRSVRCYSVTSSLTGNNALGPTMNASTEVAGRIIRQRSLQTSPKHGPYLGLEQLMHATHTDADGMTHVGTPVKIREEKKRQIEASQRHGRRRTYHW